MRQPKTMLTHERWSKNKPLLLKEERFIKKGRPKARPKRPVGDKGYDSEPLRGSLGKRGIKIISAYRKNRKNKKVFKQVTREGYRRRYKVEQTSAESVAFAD